MKIYTQTGDQGKTSLLSGERLFKDHIRVRAYGEVDELNAVIGALSAALPANAAGVAEELKQIQSDLFHAGAWLATTPDTEPQGRLTPVTLAHSRRIEASIDAMEAQLPELKSFILPAGHPTATWAHLARTVCRRAERTAVELARQSGEAQARDEALAAILVFLNRLSDYLFVLARWLNQNAGVADVPWQG